LDFVEPAHLWFASQVKLKSLKKVVKKKILLSSRKAFFVGFEPKTERFPPFIHGQIQDSLTPKNPPSKIPQNSENKTPNQATTKPIETMTIRAAKKK
jgi:hypothetical protein